jgi:glycosyltransferase involved in cell wall biosynthesis
MFSGKIVAVVVPAHNEERLIIKAVQQIPKYVDHVVVVDDASTDGTSLKLAEIPARPGFQWSRHDVNLGVGGAIVTGYKLALQAGAEIVAVMAGDAQMDPADLPAVLAPVARGVADYAKGDRLSWPGAFLEMPLARFVGNCVLTRLTRFTSGYKDVNDSQCGFTAVNARMLRSLDLESLYQRYGFPNDILAHLHTLGARVVQVPVRPIYDCEKSEISIYTAAIKVPIVLLRSMALRLQREDHRGLFLVKSIARPKLTPHFSIVTELNPGSLKSEHG